MTDWVAFEWNNMQVFFPLVFAIAVRIIICDISKYMVCPVVYGEAFE